MNSVPAKYSPGLANGAQALDVDGYCAIIRSASDITYPSSLTAFTLSIWVCPKAVPNSGDVSIAAFANKSNWGTYYGQIKFVPNNSDPTKATAGKFQIAVKSATTDVIVTGRTEVPCDGKTWYYVVGSAKNADKVRLYVNGVEDNTAQNLDAIATTEASGPFFVSRKGGGNGTPYFKGYIGNIGLYFNQFEP
ncbi:MAG TPA: LamG-like jellyroll fold domain-containing protein [Armatimonadota bacterium]|nr:LamG-like jellyroll fold domain-containing protein [Armatimonadota bacterium]